MKLFDLVARIVPALLLFSLWGCSGKGGDPVAPKRNAGAAVPPEKALSTFELAPGFKIELLAAEPLISDPVDMEIDEYGRLYVVEMHGYPLDKTGTGVVKLLTDSDGDGRMDKSTVFADGLVLPNSVMRWKKGVLITDAPNVLYLEDTDGDNKADIKDTMLTGFALSNPQHNLNSPVYGMDNWIYLGHEGAVATQTYQKEFGDKGREIYFPAQPGNPRLEKNASGRSVRFRPDQRLLETTSGNTQFGHTFDEWGHHFLVSNWNHSIHEVIAATYLQRNPELLASGATQSLSDHNDAAEVFPITRVPERQLLTDVGVITSACGITRYLGAAFPAPYDKAIFVAEPVSNLVHADRLADKGASFVAGRIQPHKEFLAATDAWFRPVNMFTGPDGALYVVDYYRQIIEHPEWMGEEVVTSGQLYKGHDKGRIYRITTTDAKAADWMKAPKLGDASGEQLVAHLSNPNVWWRLNAQRLLVDRKDKGIMGTLKKMAQHPTSPLGRLHALWTLEGLEQLTPDLIGLALRDPVAGIRQNAIKLAELHLTASPSLSKALIPLEGDTNSKVRFQLLCTLGFVNTAEALQVRNNLLFRDINDPWVKVAALSSTSAQTASLLNVVLDSFRQEVPAYASLVKQLGAMVGGSGKQVAIRQLIYKALRAQPAEWRAPLLQGLAQGLATGKSRSNLEGTPVLLVKTFFESPSASLRKASLDLLKVIGIQDQSWKKEVINKAASIAGNENQPEANRVEAIQFITLDNPAPYAALLQKLISPNEHSSVQLASLQTLSVIPGTTVSHYLLQQWPGLTPELQHEAMKNFLTDTARIALLLNAIETGKVQPASLGWNQAVKLMAQPNLKLRAKARMLLTKEEEERETVNKAYQQALTLNGNPEKGKNVYLKHCSSCHQVRGSMGINFGPDLSTIHNWSAEAIMANILAPNLSISSGYDLWDVTLHNKESFQGIISSETATAIKMVNAGREERIINRKDITSLKALNMSSMPAGFEKQINQQQMAHLLAFLRQNK